MTLVPSTCPLDCPDACGVLVETDERRGFVRVKGNPAHGFSRGALCGKTSLYGEIVHHPDRLLAPRVRTERGGWREVSWEEAYGAIAKGLERSGRREVLAAYYGGTMGLVQRKFPLRAMHALSAVLVDDGLCDHTATIGYRCVLGDAIGPDIQWIESYVTGDKAYCVYLAKDESTIRQHAQKSGFPANRIAEVTRMIDPTTAAP